MDVMSVMPHQLLKQAPPFLFIDRVEKVEENRIVCVKNLAYNEPFFAGHFPGQPVVPGVLMIEMAAQASMLLAISMEESETTEPRIAYLVQSKDFRFYNQVKPGDTLRIRVDMTDQVGNYQTTKVLITIGDTNKKAAKGELIFYLP